MAGGRVTAKGSHGTSVHGTSKHGSSRHVEGCECVRCTGFPEGNEWRAQPANELAVRHGAYSAVRISKRAEEIVALMAKDFRRTTEDMAVGAVAIAWAQVEAGARAMEAVADDPAKRLKAERLSADLRKWIGSLYRALDRLGATPAANAELVARLTAAGVEMRLTPEEREEKRELEQQCGGDLLQLEWPARRRLDDLRQRAAGRA
jgi:hypothetical protein